MPKILDFRQSTVFRLKGIDESGKNIGKTAYWKLYAIENIFRIIIHSVLSVQLNSSWWVIAADQNIQNKAQRFKNNYSSRPWHTAPGNHDIYYIDLCDIGEIIRANSHLFAPVIPDIDQWIGKIEAIRLPRNIIAHMNFPGKTDQQRIGIFYNDVVALAVSLQTNHFTFLIP